MQNSNGSHTITATVAPQIIKESRIQPVWHVIVLNGLTVCFYAPIWFFKNAKDLSNRLNHSPTAKAEPDGEDSLASTRNARNSTAKKLKASNQKGLPAKGEIDESSSGGKTPVRISVRDSSHEQLAPLTVREKNSLDLIKRVPPIFLILGMALPVINFFLGVYFFKMVAELYPDETSIVRKQPLMMGAALALTLVGSLCLCKLPNIYFLFYVPAVCIPLSIAQHWLNKYWQAVELDKELLIRHSFSTLELVMLIFGIMLLGLIIAGFCIVPFDIQHK